MAPVNNITDTDNTTAEISPDPASLSPITLNLKLLPSKIYKTFLSYYDTFDKQELLSLFSHFIEDIGNRQFEFTPDSDPKVIVWFRKLLSPDKWESLKRDELLRLYVQLTRIPENISALALTDPRLTLAWQTLLRYEETDGLIIETIIGRPIEIISHRSWYSNIHMSELYFGALEIFFPAPALPNSNLKSRYLLSMTRDIRFGMAESILGESAIKPVLTQTLPDDQGFIIERFEKAMPTDLYFLESMPTSEELLNSKGTVSPAKLKQIKKLSSISEFIDTAIEWRPDRIELLVMVYAIYRKVQDNQVDLCKFVRFVAKNLAKEINGVRFSVLLPHFIGFNKSWAAASDIERMVEFVNKFLMEGRSEWQSLSNIRLRFMCYKPKSSFWCPKVTLFDENQQKKHQLRRRNDESNISDLNWTEDIDIPFLLNWMQLLCAFGLLEIAYSRDIQESEKTYDCMRWVRLTSLGLYAFGLDRSYKPTEIEKNFIVDFDDRNLILSISTADNPHRMMLEQMTEVISPTRFHFTTPALMRNCTRRADLKDRIINLSKIVNPKNYPGLQRLINETLKRTDIGTRIKTTYTIYDLRKDIPHITQLFATDPGLRRLCILAEGGKILIPDYNLNEFKAYLLTLGYMID